MAIKDYLEELTVNLVSSLLPSHKKLDLIKQFDEVQLHVDIAIPLGLIANEVITNALKYGYRNEDEQYLEVKLKNLNDGNIEFTVRDNGFGFHKDSMAAGSSFGMKLVNILTRQIGGDLTFENREGAYCRLLAPAKIS